MNTWMTDVRHPPPAAPGAGPTSVLRTPDDRYGRPSSEERSNGQLTGRLLWLTIALIPLAVGWVVWATPGGSGDFNQRVTLAPFDLALGGLVVVWAGGRLRDGVPRPTWSAGVLLAAAFTAVYVIAFAAHPSWRGFEYAMRLLAGVAVVDVVRRMHRDNLRRTCVVLVGAGVFESVLAVAQSINGRGFSLYPFDYASPLYAFGDAHAARAGLSHPYHLTVFLLLAVFGALIGSRDASARELRLWLGATALLGAGLAVTFSRAMILGLVPAALVWCIARRDRIGRAARPMVGALFLGLVCTSLVFASGWTARAQQSTGSGADRGRVALAEHSLGVSFDHPFAGVGPARYVIALSESAERDVELLPPHNIVAQAAAELGVAGGVVVALAGLWFARRLLRRPALLVGGAGLLVPFLLLDAYPYVFPTGLAISAILIGLLENTTLRERTP